MNGPVNPNPRNVGRTWRFDTLAGRFDSDQRSGNRPRIEYFLRLVPVGERERLLRELIGIELKHRVRSGERPTPAEYRDRFPKHFPVIDAAFREAHPITEPAIVDETAVPVTCTSPGCGYFDKSARPSLVASRKCPDCGGTLRIVSGHLGDDAQTPLDVPQSDIEAPPPPSLGRFLVKERLGAGGFGVVFRAFDPLLEREVAIKLPRSAPVPGTGDVGRCVREARAAARLRHPNIVPIHDAGPIGDSFYIAFAYVESTSLAFRIKQGPVDPREAARITLALAEALDYAHRSEIVHCDIKPQNVLIMADGTPLITDFGLARPLATDETPTQVSVVEGTPAYMAPEQVAGFRGTAKSDQYSLGVLLYELLTGRKPFPGYGQAIVTQILSGEPIAPRTHDPAIPRELEAICQKAMKKESARRYASCQAMADDLARYLKGEAILARPSGWLEAIDRWARKPQRIRDAGVFAMLIAAFFVLHSCLGVVNVFLGTVPTVRPKEALFWLTVVTLGHLPVGYIGWRVLSGSKRAIVLGILVSVWGCAFTVANISYGFFDAGGLLSSLQEIRVLNMIFLLISLANLVLMPTALYARRHWREDHC